MDWDEEVEESAEEQAMEVEHDSEQPNPKKRKFKQENGGNEDPDAKRQKRKEAEQKRKEIRLSKPNAQLEADLLKMWEVFRKDKMDEKLRMDSIDKAMAMLKGKVSNIIFKSAASRVIQTIAKRGNNTHRSKIFEEVKDQILDLAKNHYGHHILKKILKYGDKTQCNFVVKQFYSHVVQLAKHKEASHVLEFAFSNVCNAQQRAAFTEEFYGAEYALIKSETKRTLETLLAENPEKKFHIKRHLKDRLTAILNKAEFSALLNNSILHTPFLNFFELADEKERGEMISRLSEHAIRLIHTKQGAMVGWYCVTYGSAKDRKAFVRSMKSYSSKVCQEEFGHTVLLRIFDCVDDTVLVNKTITVELKKDLLDIVKDRFGRRTILHLLSPHNKRYLPQGTLELLQPATIPDPEDPTKQISTSKKDAPLRRKELLTTVFPALKDICLQRAFTLITDFNARDVLFETINHATDEAVGTAENRTELINAVLESVGFKSDDDKKNKYGQKKKFHALDFMQEQEEKSDIMLHPLAHRTLRRMIDELEGFSELLLAKIEASIVEYAQSGFSSWVVFSLLASIPTRERVVGLLRPSLAALKKVTENLATALIVKYLERPSEDIFEREAHHAADGEAGGKAEKAKGAAKKSEPKKKEQSPKKVEAQKEPSPKKVELQAKGSQKKRKEK